MTRPNNDAIIECLLSHGADFSPRDNAMRDALVWDVLFQAHENALRLIKAGARAEHGFSSSQSLDGDLPYEKCVLGLCVKDDAFLPCTKLILRTHPDFPDRLLRGSMYPALRYVSKNHATIRWWIERGVGLGPLQEEELRNDRLKINLSTEKVACPYSTISLPRTRFLWTCWLQCSKNDPKAST